MHPYLMQRLLKERGKDHVINLCQRATLYKTIDRLRRDGLIAVREKSRQGERPERTVYEATDAGRAVIIEWMREMLSSPGWPSPPAEELVVLLPAVRDSTRIRSPTCNS